MMMMLDFFYYPFFVSFKRLEIDCPKVIKFRNIIKHINEEDHNCEIIHP